MMVPRWFPLFFLLMFASRWCCAEPWPMVDRVDRQPLLSQLSRLIDSLHHLGSPFAAEDLRRLEAARVLEDDSQLTIECQKILDRYCLAAVSIGKEGAPRVVKSPAPLELEEQGWRVYLVKVLNPERSRARLRISSPNARPLPHSPAEEIASRWLDVAMFDGQPMTPSLTGVPLEYRVVEVYSRDAGDRVARFDFAAPSRSADIDHRSGSILADWRFDFDTAGWKAMNQVELKAERGALQVQGVGDDPFFGVDLPEPVEGGKYLLRFWARAEQSGVGQFFWWTAERPQADGGHVVSFNVEGGREMLYEIRFSERQPLIGMRIDPNGKPCQWRVDWVELTAAEGGQEWTGADFQLVTRPSHEVTFQIVDDPDRPAMGCFEITDAGGRVYPPQAKRLAPDLFFQRQIYRGDGETIRLPAGIYSVRCSRGPETIPETKTLEVTEGPAEFSYQVKRWIDPSRRGYWSGDHHIHAAGCAHYENPTQGIHPPDMLRHCMGEDLKVGCCLTWGPCFDYQKQFFSGKLDDNSRYPYLIRYDIEVSGFGSHASGHLNLLRLKQQIPPGGESKEHWPTLGLNTLRWAKRQGAVCGPAHSANGLTRFVDRVPNTEGQDGPGGLPTFNIPAFDGIGANEFIMNVAHTVQGPDGLQVPAVDFISTMDTDRIAEFNMWYHVLNSGFQVRASGETDFPCISGERVGLGRVYVRLDGQLDFDRWCDALAAGRSYVSDGRAHLMEFMAHRESHNPLEIGTQDSTLRLEQGETIGWSVLAAVAPEPGGTAKVELVVNGFPVADREIPADGKEHMLRFEQPIEKSSWAAIRILPSAHTNPVFIEVAGKPVRANRDSVRWCLNSLEQCWKAKVGTYRGEEREQAREAYELARERFEAILSETE